MSHKIKGFAAQKNKASKASSGVSGKAADSTSRGLPNNPAAAEPSGELTREEIEDCRHEPNLPQTVLSERLSILCNMALRSLDLQEAVAQAQREIELSFQMLEAYGVPRRRARYVHNGIDVLATRYAREAQAAESAVAERSADLQSALSEVEIQKALVEERTRERDEAVRDAARYRWLRCRTHVEGYWIDGAGGVDTHVRLEGSGEWLDKRIDEEMQNDHSGKD